MNTIKLAADHSLSVERIDDADVVSVRMPDGDVGVTIHIGPDGVSVDLQGGSLEIRTSGSLTVDAEELTLRGREGVVLESGKDARLNVARRLVATAEDQNLRATLGDLTIRANDDVKVDGERIRMNC